jgi:hypothetical protein
MVHPCRIIAERFELRASFFASRSHICGVSELKNRDSGKDQQASPELLVSIEASVGRAPPDWMLGAQCLDLPHNPVNAREVFSICRDFDCGYIEYRRSVTFGR